MVPGLDYGSIAQAYGAAHGQLFYYVLLEQSGHIRILRNKADFDDHLGAWKRAIDNQADKEAGLPVGIVLGFEGADAVVTPGDLDYWWSKGVRYLGLTHYGKGRYAGGTGTEDGLEPEGRELLSTMERLGIALDVSHCSDASFDEALTHFVGPVFASHCNCRALVPGQRQLSNPQIEAIGERQGVIGVTLDAWMLQSGWVQGSSSNKEITLDSVIDHIDHICQLVGSAGHAAIGSDLDGGFGRDESPCDLDTIADLMRLTSMLDARGYRSNEIADILYGNWTRFMLGALPAMPEDLPPLN
jgi:membrane dipeptidase